MTNPLHFSARKLFTLLLSSVTTCVVFGAGCDSGNTSNACAAGEAHCACFSNGTCNVGYTCMTDICVAANAGGSTSTNNPAAGGSGQNSTGGAGPSATGGNGQGATTGGSGQGSATGGAGAVNNSPVIDAFASCDDKLESNGGRSGKWYYFSDSGYNATHGYGDPGTQWADHGCSAWIILGCTSSTACTYAGIGFQLSEGNPYDLSAYSGVSVAFEGGDNVYFVVKTSDGGYFGTWLTGTSGNQTRNADFAALSAMSNSAVTTLNSRLITEMQFTVGKTLAASTGFGLAIHSVSLR